ncbi:SusD/RagB family nutrient-binding outer membrane lipoprotein [Capnocytophaga leadbetteri]|uniref:SusD/RagB family nutrient-binding outer membrane lipoprotein n=1 Tax=Capnocytophaga leadbetteri TaxID=327575 RepID=UPI0028E298B9|nr:SusD/RagB family nutrient-binding outer membrane lipoprotein [Capnocytophaga leadbetteri]
MKILNKHIAIMALSSVFFTSCIKDFEEVNTNQLQPTDEQASRDGMSSGGYFAELVSLPIPTGTGTGPANDYQVIQNMSTDNWVGYFSPGRNHWDGGNNQTSYYLSDFRVNGTFSTLIKIMNPYFQMKTQTHNVKTVNGRLVYESKDISSQAIYSLAQIVKIMGMHRTTDLFGPIPYSDMEPGKVKAKYDTQEQVYRSFLQELDEAVATLSQYGVTNKVLEEYDPVYGGDTSKWIRLGNSLMLRLAMRVRYADPALAQQYITKATTNAGGLIENDDQAGKLATSSKYIFHHSLVTMLGYKELKMGATIYSYLVGYNDPRAEKYFTKNTAGTNQTDFYAVRSGINPVTDATIYEKYSEPTVVNSTPTYWLRASEVQFLLAEAALIGWYTNDTAENLYKKGIELSFTENGLTAAQAQSYYNSSALPANYIDLKNSSYSVNAVSTIDKKWLSSGTEEEQLEQIITQKYLANYPNGFESWSEWKRTGYPRMFGVPFDLSNKGTQNVSSSGKEYGVRRYPFPQKEFELNRENVTAAQALLGGTDNAATNVWWDKKTK